MALRTIRENLAFAQYDNPSQVNDDLALIFKNSKAYNTNKKSRVRSCFFHFVTIIALLVWLPFFFLVMYDPL